METDKCEVRLCSIGGIKSDVFVCEYREGSGYFPIVQCHGIRDLSNPVALQMLDQFKTEYRNKGKLIESDILDNRND